MTSGAQGKVVELPELLRRREDLRRQGRRLVQCHGCFDIVHPGHVRHLRFARAQGDALLVSITGDAGISKGAGRPLIPQELRAESLAELDCVDLVCIDPNPTAQSLLAAVGPDVYVKGREYETNDDERFRAERHAVERAGGRVVFSSGDVVFSSTALIAALERETDPFQQRLTRLIEDPALSEDRLDELIASMRGKTVIVVGEVIRDIYTFCDRAEVAGEAPTLSLRPLEERGYDGGAAIIARHAAALGAKPVLVTALPQGGEAEAMVHRLGVEGVEVRAVRAATPLAEKHRFLVGMQKVMKLDRCPVPAMDAQRREAITALAAEAAEGADAAVIADFGLGLLTPASVSALCKTLRPRVGVLSGDISGRRGDLRAMRGLDVVCPAEHELRDAYRAHGEGLPAVVWSMLDEGVSDTAIITLGAEGVIGFDRLPGATPSATWHTRLKAHHVPAFNRHAVDALGCGDALLAAATLARAAGAGTLAASFIGSAAASVEARTLGNAPVGHYELRRELGRLRAARLAYAPSIAGDRATGYAASPF